MTNLEKYNNVFCENLQITEDQLVGLQYQGICRSPQLWRMLLISCWKPMT